MRVVGYVRESADPGDARPAFEQHEHIRRFCTTRGDHLVSVCQDARQPGHALGRDGYRSLLGVIASGGADAVVVSRLDALASDLVVQEILLWDLRTRGIRVMSTDDTEANALSEDPGPMRQFVRDVLIRVAEHAQWLSPPPIPRPPGGADIVVELLASEPAPDATTPR